MLLTLSPEIQHDHLGHHVSDGMVGVSVGTEGKLFKRNAMKNALSPNMTHVVWFVGEIDGVRCYICRRTNGQVNVVMTRADLWP